MSDSRPVIVSAVRTPIGKFGGKLKSFRSFMLAGIVMNEAIRRAGIPSGIIDDIIFGECLQHPAEANTARTAALNAGIPFEVPAVTIQRQCASGMQSVIQGSQSIRSRDADIILAGGVESMSNAAYYLDSARWGKRLQHGELTDAVWELLYSGSRALHKPMIMGETAELLAEKYGITRDEQDEIALRSHTNAEDATRQGRFKDEIVPVNILEKISEEQFDCDENPRYGMKIDDLRKMKPAFKDGGTVTAGNSSSLNDGAAALVLMSESKARELRIKPLGRILSHAVAGVEPRSMGYGPVPATRKALKKAGLVLKDMGLVEINEAFAAQYLVCEKELGLDREITNPNGSGIGLGHPVGSTGARIIVSLLYEMKKRKTALGLATLCVGGGMGAAVILENVD
jgi:acetyl-CoA C-acetyltransferase